MADGCPVYHDISKEIYILLHHLTHAATKIKRNNYSHDK